ncbi:replication initiator protein A, partial [Arsenophonus nasoniae]|uniref:replication initiator protein A n=1 Tax=Arsenophonus nasoniae TaxID=638 RepID=UPI003879C1F3
YQAITKTKVLQISPDYFRIRKAIDRRIYEIARKHCGNQHEFIISLEKLHLKTGSVSSIRLFKQKLKTLFTNNDLPDYEVLFDPITDKVTFKNRNQNCPKVEASRKREKGKKEIFKIKRSLQKN